MLEESTVPLAAIQNHGPVCYSMLQLFTPTKCQCITFPASSIEGKGSASVGSGFVSSPIRKISKKTTPDNPGETLLSLHSARNIDQAVSLLQNGIAQMTC